MSDYSTDALLFAYPDGEIYCENCANPDTLECPGQPHTGYSDYIPRCCCCYSRERDAYDSLTEDGKVYEALSLVKSLHKLCNDPPALLRPNYLFKACPSELDWYEDLADVLREAWDYTYKRSHLYDLYEPVQKLLATIRERLYSLQRFRNVGPLQSQTLNTHCQDILILCESLQPLLNYLDRSNHR